MNKLCRKVRKKQQIRITGLQTERRTKQCLEKNDRYGSWRKTAAK